MRIMVENPTMGKGNLLKGIVSIIFGVIVSSVFLPLGLIFIFIGCILVLFGMAQNWYYN